MILRICMTCGIETGPPIDDGKAEVDVSHTYCQACGALVLADLDRQFAALPPDRAQVGAV